MNALWPIMWCLAFAESAIGAISFSSDVPGWLTCTTALAMLLMVLYTYWRMYSKYPGFLTLTGQDAVELGKFRMLLETADLEWLERLNHRTLTALMRPRHEISAQDIQRDTGENNEE